MSARWYPLSQAVVCKASGKDARRYLNNRLSNDLRSLAYPGSALAAALTAQGKVQGLYTVFATRDEAFLLACDGGARQALFAALGKFIVADRVSLEDVSNAWAFVHLIASEEEARSLAQLFGSESVYMRLSRRLGESGFDLLLPSPSIEETLRVVGDRLGTPMTSADYQLTRLRQGQPTFPDEINEGVVLTECGTRDAVSFTKGCYVGQEVIERSDAIGKLPRTLERVVLSGTHTTLGAPIANARGETIGKIASYAADETSATTYAFALLRTGVYSAGEQIACEGLQGYITKI
jgi:folate-binding protein YgfZ